LLYIELKRMVTYSRLIEIATCARHPAVAKRSTWSNDASCEMEWCPTVYSYVYECLFNTIKNLKYHCDVCMTVHHWYNYINNQLDVTITVY